MKVNTSKIRVLEPRHQGNHREVVKQLEECLAIAKDDPEVHTVIVCLEDRSKNVTTYWSPCEDRAWLGSRLILAGMRRMGFKT